MKIQPDDFKRLRLACLTVLRTHPEARNAYAERGLSAERFRWDVFHASRFDTRPLLTYLNDSHIDTALRRIVGA